MKDLRFPVKKWLNYFLNYIDNIQKMGRVQPAASERKRESVMRSEKEQRISRLLKSAYSSGEIEKKEKEIKQHRKGFPFAVRFAGGNRPDF